MKWVISFVLFLLCACQQEEWIDNPSTCLQKRTGWVLIRNETEVVYSCHIYTTDFLLPNQGVQYMELPEGEYVLYLNNQTESLTVKRCETITKIIKP